MSEDEVRTLHEMVIPVRDPGTIFKPKHSHYFKPCPFSHVDVYRVLSMFGVTDPCLQHAVKKLLVAGGRGHKDISRDVQDAIDTLTRWQEMRHEEEQPKETTT